MRPARRAARAGLAALVALGAAGCVAQAGARTPGAGGRRVEVTATTNFVADLARQVGGDRVAVTGLMGPGVDPHLYKASAADVVAMDEADLVLYGGLDLEGRMADLFAGLAASRPVVAVTSGLSEADLLTHDGGPDPHVWFDVALWKSAARTAAAALARVDPAFADHYGRRAGAYATELDRLDAWVRTRLAGVAPRSRVLVTSHDAFAYFGRAYGFEVQAIQGISTATEATTADVERVAGVVAERGVRAVFVESSVSPRTLAAVAAAAGRRGQAVRDGGALFTDAAGPEGTPTGTYVGMFRHNVDLVVSGLRGAPAPRSAQPEGAPA